ncbi:Protein of unknown function [Massilia yuzhufengensis]|uniref:DUF3304 domain-containing protein n=2 Tax=Massilia yuzhufengensis TaxID=1164594 RepID=A0A1I1UQT4_9BURK|nr:Protein of unknown function [Massilia yuzhufengensis]
MPKSMLNRAAPVLMFLLIETGLSACGRPTTVDVSLHGVNYSEEPFSYSVKDPTLADQRGAGGELIDPFAAGGTTCCATLPKTWRPGIKLQVNTTHWLEKRPDGELPEIKGTHLVEVPRYPDGKPGELWVLRAADGGISVVSSDFQPDHLNWPGTVKGWPVPSLKYRRERWKIILNHELTGIYGALSLLYELETDPKGRARVAWEFAEEHERESIKGFSGPDDPKYLVFLRKDYNEYFENSRNRVRQVMEEQP